MNWTRHKKLLASTKQIDFFYSRDSCRVSASIISPINSQSRPFAVLFCHGTGNDRFYPQHDLYRAILESGFYIFCFDIDGHGQESTTKLQPEKFRDCLVHAVKICKERLPSFQIIIMGHSLGASLALSCENQPEIVGVVAISPAIDPNPNSITLLRESFGFLRPHALYQMVNYGLFGALPAVGKFKRSRFPIRLFTKSTSNSQLFYLSAIRACLKALAIPERLLNSKMRMLVVTGSKDTLTPPQQLAALLSRIDVDPNMIQHTTIQNENHMTLIFSRRCIKVIIDFLEEVSCGVSKT